MKHIRRFLTSSSFTTLNGCHPEQRLIPVSDPCSCHPERSTTICEANRAAQSKDPVFLESATGIAGDFRIEVHFFDDQGAELSHLSSGEVAVKCHQIQR